MSIAPVMGSMPLVVGQQAYDIVFGVAFTATPSVFVPSVAMPSSSGEVFTATYDLSTLTTTGVTVWLSGIPTAASSGGEIQWVAYGNTEVETSTPSGTGITVPQLFHRMGRRAIGGDFTKLDLSGQTDLCEAANAALQRLYDALPTYFKEQTQGFTLPAPVAITNVGVTRFSKFITGFTFTEAQFGMTVTLEGDGQWNQIIGTDELLNPYQGSTGTVGGTIYGNAWHSDTYPLDRIIGNPFFANTNNTPLFRTGILGANQGGAMGWLFSQAVGLPQCWWTQVFGNSQGKKPIMVLRFAPAPDTNYAMSVRMGFWPKRLTLADYNSATELVVPDQFIEPALIPMAVQAMMTTPIWNSSPGTDYEKRVAMAGNEGEAFCRRQYGQIGAPNNRVFTPIGF
jgi:hypothetical protein